MRQSQSVELRAFVAHVSCVEEDGRVVISLALSHRDPDLNQPPLTAEMVRVHLADDRGKELIRIEQPEGQLIATTGPGIVTHARYVFQASSPDSKSKALTISVVDTATLTIAG